MTSNEWTKLIKNEFKVSGSAAKKMCHSLYAAYDMLKKEERIQKLIEERAGRKS